MEIDYKNLNVNNNSKIFCLNLNTQSNLQFMVQLTNIWLFSSISLSEMLKSEVAALFSSSS